MTLHYVTHDRKEALTMSDHVAVSNGRPHRAGRLAAGCLCAARDRSSSPALSDVQHPRARRPPFSPCAPNGSSSTGVRTGDRSPDVVFVGAFTRNPRRHRGPASGLTIVKQNDVSGLEPGTTCTSAGRTRTRMRFNPEQLEQRSNDEAHVALTGGLRRRARLPAAGVTKQAGRHLEHDRVGGLLQRIG